MSKTKINNNEDTNEGNEEVDMATQAAECGDAADAITKLGMLISSLMKFVKPKNNVHLYIKEQLRIMKVTYDKALDDFNVGQAESAEQTEQASQTSPKLIEVTAKAGLSETAKQLKQFSQTSTKLTKLSVEAKKGAEIQATNLPKQRRRK